MNFSHTDILRLEELSLNAYPPLHTLHHRGWILCFAAGQTRRINSVQPLYNDGVPPSALDARIDACEQVYHSQRQRVIFKLTPASPPGLEAILAARGYLREADSAVHVAALDLSSLSPDAGDIRIDDAPDSNWLDTYCEWARLDRAVMGRVFASILPRAGFLRLMDDHAVIAHAYGVVEAGWLGIYGVVVRADRRGRGIGGQITRCLMEWGAAQGATRAYLQVMLSNAPALALYARLGFSEAYRYWYRQRA